MPKAKTKTSKSSNKLISTKRFSLSRIQILLVILVVAAVGSIVVYKSFAGTVDFHYGVYQWNSTNYYGAVVADPKLPRVIAHNGGGLQTRVVAGKPNANRTFWAGTNGGSLDAVGTGHMWYGPYTNVPGGNKRVHICWLYVPPDNHDAKVRFDVTYNGGRSVFYTSDRTIRHVPPAPTVAGGQKLWYMQTSCIDKTLTAPVYNSFEIRVQMLGGGSSSEDAFRLWRTTWQVAP